MKLDTPLIKVIRVSRRLNIALFGVLPLLLVLGGRAVLGAGSASCSRKRKSCGSTSRS